MTVGVAGATENRLGQIRSQDRLLQKGIGTARNLEAAMAWFRRAAERGHHLAMLELAQTLEQGLGVPADPAAARQWRERAKAVPQQARGATADQPRGDQRVDPRRPRP